MVSTLAAGVRTVSLAGELEPWNDFAAVANPIAAVHVRGALSDSDILDMESYVAALFVGDHKKEHG